MKKKNMTTSETESVFERFRLMRTCQLCSYQFGGSEAHVLEEYAGGCMVHITCPKCKNAVVSLVIVSKLGISSMSMVTDLSVIDSIHLRRRGPITQEELLRFHEYLDKKLVFEKNIVSS